MGSRTSKSGSRRCLRKGEAQSVEDGVEGDAALVEGGGDRIKDEYETFLDHTDRDTDGGEERLEELLENFADTADDARNAHRRATGQARGIRGLLGNRSPEQAQQKYESKVRELRSLAKEIDRLKERYPIGPEATARWNEIQGTLAKL